MKQKPGDNFDEVFRRLAAQSLIKDMTLESLQKTLPWVFDRPPLTRWQKFKNRMRARFIFEISDDWETFRAVHIGRLHWRIGK